MTIYDYPEGLPIDAWKVGIYAGLRNMNPEETATLAYRVSRVTHGHPLAVFPAVECALAIRSILLGEKAVPGDLSDPGKHSRYLEPEKNARYCLYQAKRSVPMDQLAPSTGLWMWRYVFEHSFGMSDGCSWDRMPEFEPGLLAAINGGVDKDTTGAVAGAVLGTYWGEEQIPERWKINVEKRDRIRDLANQFIVTIDKENKNMRQKSQERGYAESR